MEKVQNRCNVYRSNELEDKIFLLLRNEKVFKFCSAVILIRDATFCWVLPSLFYFIH